MRLTDHLIDVLGSQSFSKRCGRGGAGEQIGRHSLFLAESVSRLTL
jgi:hypothetical protein